MGFFKRIQTIIRDIRPVFAAVAGCCLLAGCQQAPPDIAEPPQPDLLIYTAQEEEVYAPVVKEFSERTGMSVQVKTGTSDQLIALLSEPEQKTGCDVIFGVTIETLESSKELWQPYESPEAQHIAETFRSPDYSWTTFSTLPLVIMYNTKVVTYREVPTGWRSLLEPRWRGRVAFVNPETSDIYAYALNTAVHACPETDHFLKRFAENINYQMLDQISDVNSGISTGLYSLGVTLEESAQVLLNEGADIDYIYPEEGTIAISDGTAILKQCPHPEAAKAFLDFTISQDTQRILVSYLNRRSIREDITPLSGLAPIRQLPLISYDPALVPQEHEDLLDQWTGILEDAKRRADR